MEMLKCEKCGKEFKTAHAVKIHNAIKHGNGRKRRGAKRANRPGKTVKGALVCKACGRTFNLPAHLARHASVAHPKARKARKARKVGRPAGRRSVAGTMSTTLDVRSLTIDQLLALKKDVDVRLADIVQQMRAARVGV
jgi:DNA-directed RNA polymerase subunit M/transcription elongation factor TFIIS